MTALPAPAFSRNHRPLIWGFQTREPSPEVFLLTSGSYQNLFARTGHGPVHVDAPEPLAPYIERGRP
jgi:hypothetical protein